MSEWGLISKNIYKGNFLTFFFHTIFLTSVFSFILLTFSFNFFPLHDFLTFLRTLLIIKIIFCSNFNFFFRWSSNFNANNLPFFFRWSSNFNFFFFKMTYKRRGSLVEAFKQKLQKDAEYDDSKPESIEGNNYSYYRHFHNVNTRLY